MRELPEAITSWSFEPGHTEAEFRARHMMVTWVRGLFKGIHGRVELHRDDPLASTFEARSTPPASGPESPSATTTCARPTSSMSKAIRRSPFGDASPSATGDTHFRAAAKLTLRGITREVALEVVYQGQWATPYWVGDENRGELRWLGFEARTVLNRHA